MNRSIFFPSEVIMPGHNSDSSLNLDMYASMSEFRTVRFHNSCSIFWISPRGQYLAINISFNSAQGMALATARVMASTCPVHQVRAWSTNVHATNFTFISSGHSQISNSDSTFSIHLFRVIIPPVPLKVRGLALVKSL